MHSIQASSDGTRGKGGGGLRVDGGELLLKFEVNLVDGGGNLIIKAGI